MTNKTTISKEEALAMFNSPTELAQALKITQSAVSQWSAGKPIPEAQALKIRYQLKPELFTEGAMT